MLKAALRYVALLLAALTVWSAFSLADEPVSVEQPSGNVTFSGIDAKKAAAGDIIRVSFAVGNPTLAIAIAFPIPPFSTGAGSLEASGEITFFSGAAPDQQAFSIHLTPSGTKGVQQGDNGHVKDFSARDVSLEIVVQPPSGCGKVGISATIKLLFDAGWCRDELPFTTVRLTSPGASPPPTPALRVLSRDKYTPPLGEFAKHDDAEAARALFEEAKALASKDALAAFIKAEDAYSLAPTYDIKLNILKFLEGLKKPPSPDADARESAKIAALKSNEHLRLFSSVEVTSGPGKILKASMARKICEKYGLPYNGASEEDERRSYLDSIKTGQFAELDEARRTEGEKSFLRLASTAYGRKHFALAYRFYYEYLSYLSSGLATGDRAAAEEGLLKAADAACSDVPKEEKQKLAAYGNVDLFADHIVRPSSHFLLFGPRSAVASITETSLKFLDMAHLVESDLFGSREAHKDVRVVVFIREYYGVGGGQGGDNTILISFKFTKDNPAALQIDQHLYFHELGHCLADIEFPIPGLNEGIADIASIIVQDLFSRSGFAPRKANAISDFASAFTSHRIPIEDMPGYSPSAGMFLLPLTKVLAVDGHLDWAKLRKGLWDIQHFPIKHQNTQQWFRHYLKALEPYFGAAVYDWYRDAGVPLEPGVQAVLQDELNLYQEELNYASFVGRDALERLATTIGTENPTSFYRQMALLSALDLAAKSDDKAIPARLKSQCGIPVRMLVAGPLDVPDPSSALDLAGADHYLSEFEGAEVDGSLPELSPSLSRSTGLVSSGTDGWFEIPAEYSSRGGSVLIGYTLPLEGAIDGLVFVTANTPFAVWIDDRILCRVAYLPAFGMKYDGFSLPSS
ncbi:MAG: hypothetical protein WC712_00005, partial [Candidatus Brocadiia bacterium]